MAEYVLDASVVVAPFLDEPGSDAAAACIDRLEREQALIHAPDLLLFEAANALWKRVGRDELAAVDAGDGLAKLVAMEIRLHAASRLARPALALAIAHRLTVYDAAYIALGASLGAPLVSADRALGSSAKAAGVSALGPEELASRA